MDLQNLKIAHSALYKVYRDKVYSNLVLNATLRDNKDCNAPAITSVVYGVLQKDTQLQYILDKCVTTKPKASVSVILKIGIYLLRYSKTPAYAVVDNCVKLSKVIHKGGVTSFVNAVLHKSESVALPPLSQDAFGLSINYSCPQWIVQLLIAQHGIKTATDFLAYQPNFATHIRHNGFVTTQESLKDTLGKDTKESSLGFYATAQQLKLLKKGEWTAQGLASMLVVETLGRGQENSVLDLCSAPGGKALYYLQNNPKSSVLACDIYNHRLDLIKGYANSMSAKNITVAQNDATQYNAAWQETFDIVMCDVPCSGLGLVHSKHDIVLFESASDIVKLAELQYKILENAAKYTKNNGKILYSTCTITRQENQEVVNKFLDRHKDFVLQAVDNDYVKTDIDDFLKLMPHTHGTDGFFGAVVVKKG